jgi:large subunit ribosomal protein L21
MDKSMFAIIKTGGKQYRVTSGDVIKVEKLSGNPGDIIQLNQVLAMGDDKDVKIGTPLLSDQLVSAEILEQARADKIIIFKKKRRQNYRRKKGHRQHLTVLRIIDIGGTTKAAPKKTTAKKATATPKKVVPKKTTPTPKKVAPKKTTAKKTLTKRSTKK